MLYKRVTLWAILIFVMTCVLAVVAVSPILAAPPTQPTVVAPANGATNISNSPTLSVTVSDPENNNMTVTFYGRVAATTVPTFTIVALPDTQNYSDDNPETFFRGQTQWIVNNRNTWNIAYAAHEGDIVNVAGDTNQWARADAAMDLLDAANIPYGVLPGNHDIPTTLYNTYFGVSRFQGKGYYGGSYDSTNDNNYALFSAGGMDFIVINLQFQPGSLVRDWADARLKAYSARRGIVVTHSLINYNNNWTYQAIYTDLKDNPNLFLMLCGHMHSSTDGAGQRIETGDNGNTIYILQADYQDFAHGGNGWLRLMEFVPSDNQISVKTYSPYLNQWLTDTDNQFTLSYDMTTPGTFQVIGTNTNVTSGSTTGVTWSGLNFLTQYEWYVTVNDGTSTTPGPVSQFTTMGNPTAVTLSSLTAATLGSSATVWIVIGLGGVLVIGTGAFAVGAGGWLMRRRLAYGKRDSSRSLS